MNSTTTLYVLVISYHKNFTIDEAVSHHISSGDEMVERWFTYKPMLSEIKEAIPNFDDSEINWIALEKREVEIKKTTLLHLADPKKI